MRCAIVEAETREEVMREMEDRMMQMEQRFRQRWEREVEHQEAKTDAKFEMLHHAGLLTPFGHNRMGRVLEDVVEEEDVEMSLVSGFSEPSCGFTHSSIYSGLAMKMNMTRTIRHRTIRTRIMTDHPPRWPAEGRVIPWI
jgi:hypothetical protein